jgi:hypothetical protein
VAARCVSAPPLHVLLFLSALIHKSKKLMSPCFGADLFIGMRLGCYLLPQISTVGHISLISLPGSESGRRGSARRGDGTAAARVRDRRRRVHRLVARQAATLARLRRPRHPPRSMYGF